jgi:hypothetical protein
MGNSFGMFIKEYTLAFMVTEKVIRVIAAASQKFGFPTLKHLTALIACQSNIMLRLHRTQDCSTDLFYHPWETVFHN